MQLESDRDPTTELRSSRVFIAMIQSPQDIRSDRELAEELKKQLLERGVAVRSEMVTVSNVKEVPKRIDHSKADSVLVVGITSARQTTAGVALTYDVSLIDIANETRVWRGELEVAGLVSTERVAMQVLDQIDADELLGKYETPTEPAAVPAPPQTPAADAPGG